MTLNLLFMLFDENWFNTTITGARNQGITNNLLNARHWKSYKYNVYY